MILIVRFSSLMLRISLRCGWMKISSADIWRVVAAAGEADKYGFFWFHQSGLCLSYVVCVTLCNHLNSGGFVHPGFFLSRCFFLHCLSLHQKAFFLCLLGGMLSVAGRVRHIICTDLSRQWKLRDVSSRLYMSESQLKRN